jgi:hypothetical protein
MSATELEFIKLIDTNGRGSSIQIGGRTLTKGYVSVCGNLEHCAEVKPATWDDSVKLADAITGGAYSSMLDALEFAIEDGDDYQAEQLVRKAIAKAKGTTGRRGSCGSAAATALDALDRIANGEFANSVTLAEQVASLRTVARDAIAKAKGEA